MRKLIGTIPAALAIVVLQATMNDDPHGAWDSGGDRTARSLPGSDHASARLAALSSGAGTITLVANEERSRGIASSPQRRDQRTTATYPSRRSRFTKR